MRMGMNVKCGSFPCTNTTKKSYPYTRNNCQDLSVLQKVLQPKPSKLLLATKLHN